MEVQINIDCTDPDALADFYCAALGYAREGGVAQFRELASSGRSSHASRAQRS